MGSVVLFFIFLVRQYKSLAVHIDYYHYISDPRHSLLIGPFNSLNRQATETVKAALLLSMLNALLLG